MMTMNAVDLLAPTHVRSGVGSRFMHSVYTYGNLDTAVMYSTNPSLTRDSDESSIYNSLS